MSNWSTFTPPQWSSFAPPLTPSAEPGVLSGHTGDVCAVAFSPDARWLASGSADKTVRIWDLRLRSLSRTLEGHQEEIRSVAFSPDGLKLASGSLDTTIRIWDLRQPEADARVLASQQGVWSVAFSPNGQTLASGSGETIRIWDPGQPHPRVLAGHRGLVYSIAFSPDGQSLASGSGDKTVRIWHMPSALAEIVCQDVWRNLSMDEWLQFVGEDTAYERTCPNLPSGEGAPANAPAAK